MARMPVKFVTSAADWSVALSPVRSEIVQALRLIGPCSVAEVAALIDRPPDALYRHLDRLERAGFVVKAGERRTGRSVTQLVDVAAEDFGLGVEGAAGARTLAETTRSFLRSTTREVEASAGAGAIEVGAAGRNVVVNYELSWLTPEAFAEVRRHMREIKRIMDDARPGRQGRQYLTMTVAAPVTRRGGRAGGRARPARERAGREGQTLRSSSR